MKHSFEANELSPFYTHDELVLGQKDRRTKVSDKELLTFPFNAIGWIKSKEKYAESDDFSEEAKGTGFLISPSLVLTCSHNFVIQDERNGEVIEYEPISFSTL
jgi:V8-like Glu-specific endopeptidase